MSSSLTIYSANLDLQSFITSSHTIDQLKEYHQTAVQYGKKAQIAECCIIAKVDAYLQTLKPKQRKIESAKIFSQFDKSKRNFQMYSQIGRYIIEKADTRLLEMNMDQIRKEISPPKQLAAPNPKPQKPDLSTELEQAKHRITKLEREVKDLKNEVDYLKEERDDVREWLDTNYKSGGSVAVYKKLGRTLH